MRDATQHARVGGEPFERRRDERGQTTGDAGLPHAIQRLGRAIGGQVRRVEVNSREAVDLQIEQARECDPHAYRGGMAANVFSMLSSTASVERTPASM